MDYVIKHQPSYAALVITLEPGESIVAESGAMVSMSANIEIETRARGGVLSALKRSMFGGESFFINTFTSQRGQGEIVLAPALSGDIISKTLDSETIYIQSGSFLASSSDIELNTKWGGARTFFGGEGFFMLKATGSGEIFVSSYGAIMEVEIAPGKDYIVDTGHIVAFESGVDFNIRRVGGLKSTFLSGEGLVCQFSGQGKVYVQTRSPDAFLAWLIPQIPKRSD